MVKVTMSIHPIIYQKMLREAEERGISFHELLRAVIIPEHYKNSPELPPETALGT